MYPPGRVIQTRGQEGVHSRFHDLPLQTGVTPREERLAENESFFREVNERIDDVGPTPENGLTLFVCECGDPGCSERISMSHQEYEEVRSNSARFVVRPGHVIPDVETVVVVTDRYTVVEKRGEAADVADENDPRS